MPLLEHTLLATLLGFERFPLCLKTFELAGLGFQITLCLPELLPGRFDLVRDIPRFMVFFSLDGNLCQLRQLTRYVFSSRNRVRSLQSSGSTLVRQTWGARSSHQPAGW